MGLSKSLTFHWRPSVRAVLLGAGIGALTALGAPAMKHVTNYDEAKVGAYTLPDLLTFADGERVRTAEAWNARRRPELLRLYERAVFGSVQGTAPFVRAEVLADNEPVEKGLGRRRHVILHFGDRRDGPYADVVLYLPSAASDAHGVPSAPVPALLQIVFLKGLSTGGPEPKISAAAARNVGFPEEFTEIGPVADILRQGFAYATFKYTDVQPDEADTRSRGVLGMAQRNDGSADRWSAIGVWAWAASRVLDYLATEPVVDASRVALIGHSRLGKTALWASAQDPRFALVFASCSGEMGAALSRRDFGETIDDIATMFPWWFCRNFQKYVGRWNDLPVDAHCLIALSAPRPVFLTGGTEDQWADPKGEFLAAVAADPVYRLFGTVGIGRRAAPMSPESDTAKSALQIAGDSDAFPAADEAVVEGQIGWFYHSGPHAITDSDWRTFLAFAHRHLQR